MLRIYSFFIIPYPISLNLVPTLLEIVTLLPESAHTGSFNLHFTLFFDIDCTKPTVAAELTLSINISLGLIGSTFKSSFAPTTLSSKIHSSSKEYHILGSFPGMPTTFPDSLSELTTLGSRSVITATEPPGCNSSTGVDPVIAESIVVNNGLATIWFASSTILPGL